MNRVLPIQKTQVYSNHSLLINNAAGLRFGEGNGNPLQYSCLENPMDEEPGRLQSMGLLGVAHDRVTFK